MRRVVGAEGKSTAAYIEVREDTFLPDGNVLIVHYTNFLQLTGFKQVKVLIH